LGIYLLPGTGFLPPETGEPKAPKRRQLPEETEIQSKKTRETAAKAAFALTGFEVLVSEDCLVETVDIELAAKYAVVETGLPLSQEREFSAQKPCAEIGLFAQNPNCGRTLR
jgi:hypothetical protein